MNGYFDLMNQHSRMNDRLCKINGEDVGMSLRPITGRTDPRTNQPFTFVMMMRDETIGVYKADRILFLDDRYQYQLFIPWDLAMTFFPDCLKQSDENADVYIPTEFPQLKEVIDVYAKHPEQVFHIGTDLALR